MLNYIKAELYKALHRKYLWVLLFIMLTLETLFALLWVLEGSKDFAGLMSTMTVTMPVGTYLAVLLADVVVSDPFKTGTMKNEVSFGLPRNRIYLGKLSAAAVTAVLFCAVLFAWYLGGCWLFSSHGDPEAFRTNLGILAYVAAASLPLWLATLSLALSLYMMIKNQLISVAVIVLILTGGGGILGLMSMMKLGIVAKLAALYLNMVPVIPLEAYQGDLTWNLMAENWAIGIGWTAVSTAAGIAVFRLRDIR